MFEYNHAISTLTNPAQQGSISHTLQPTPGISGNVGVLHFLYLFVHSLRTPASSISFPRSWKPDLSFCGHTFQRHLTHRSNQTAPHRQLASIFCVIVADVSLKQISAASFSRLYFRLSFPWTAPKQSTSRRITALQLGIKKINQLQCSMSHISYPLVYR